MLRITTILLLLCLLPVWHPLYAFELEVHAVTDRIYALVGETQARTESNHGLNNTLGFIETDKAVILVSSGTNELAYKKIMNAIRTVSNKPVTQVAVKPVITGIET